MVLAALAAATLSLSARADNAFPGRRLFPEVKTISLHQFEQQYNSSIIVDARVPIEYRTIHIVGAHNIPVASDDFDSKVRALRAKSDKRIIFYCNGHTCFKSYEATRRAMQAGIKNVVAFDGGVFEWARAHPKRTVLLGRSPIKVSDLISTSELDAHMLSPLKFQKMVNHQNVLIVDVRTLLQRDGVGLFPFDNEVAAGMDEPRDLEQYVDLARNDGKTLLAYDEVGKQVRWLQYLLKKKGLKHYYFLKGGSNAYIHLLAEQQGTSLAPSNH